MLRKIIKIDEDKCDGCGVCVPSCAEGALQVIDGKVRLISDLFCDGLGSCLGECPQNALTIEEREAEPYDEKKVMEYIVKGGRNVIIAHLEHLREHAEFEYLRQAKEYLSENGIDVPVLSEAKQEVPKYEACGCPGSATVELEEEKEETESGKRVSHLTQWPIQLHLVSPQAPYYQNSDLLLAADCAGFCHPDFHKDYLKGKSLAIACPKLDSHQEIYKEKLVTMINESNLKSMHVLIMQVPCCGGLFQLAKQAIEESGKSLPLKVTVIDLKGEVLKEVSI
jgi:ferredoxin